MPHIKLEHTNNITADIILKLFNNLKTILIDVAGIKKENCKCKAIYIPIYQTGTSDDLHNFMHLEISILEGRSEKVLQHIGEQSLQILKKHFRGGETQNNSNQYSVEIREIKQNNYFTTNLI